jgi:hypothetical protein
MVTMDVSDLAFADGIFHAAEAMRLDGHTFPGSDRFGDAFLRTFDAHYRLLTAIPVSGT